MSAGAVSRTSRDANRDQALIGLLVDDYGEAGPDWELRNREARRNVDAAVLNEEDGVAEFGMGPGRLQRADQVIE